MSERSERLANDSKAAAREALEERTLCLEKRGLTFDRLARETKRQLAAKKPVQIKIKGTIDNDTKLPAGAKVLAKSEEETVIQIILTDESTRSAAIDRVHKLRGDYAPDKVDVNHTATDDLIQALQDAKARAMGAKP